MPCAQHIRYQDSCIACHEEEYRRLSLEAQQETASTLRETQYQMSQAHTNQQTFQFSQYLQTPAGQHFQAWMSRLDDLHSFLSHATNQWQSKWNAHSAQVDRSMYAPITIAAQPRQQSATIKMFVFGGLTLTALVVIVVAWNGDSFGSFLKSVGIGIACLIAAAIFGFLSYAAFAHPETVQEEQQKQADEERQAALTNQLVNTFGFDPRGTSPFADTSALTAESLSAFRADMDQRARSTYPQPHELPTIPSIVLRPDDHRWPRDVREVTALLSQRLFGDNQPITGA